MNPYKTVYFEISGICNAQCPWCYNGKNKPKGSFITPIEFNRAIEHLLDNGIIGKRSCLYLYNWGEPTLNPFYTDILEIIHHHKLLYGVSTNASRYVEIDNVLQAGLVSLRISMPGFSQASYDRVHGFNFDKVLDNIKLYADSLSSKVEVMFFMYNFSVGEVGLAYQYFKDRGVKLYASVPYINDFDMGMQYLTKNMPAGLLSELRRDVPLTYVDDLIKHAPTGYKCIQNDLLTIDESSNILTCCVLPKHDACYSIGSLYDYHSRSDIDAKRHMMTCNNCIDTGMAYWMNNPVLTQLKTNVSLIGRAYNKVRMVAYI